MGAQTSGLDAQKDKQLRDTLFLAHQKRITNILLKSVERFILDAIIPEDPFNLIAQMTCEIVRFLIKL